MKFLKYIYTHKIVATDAGKWCY